MAKFVFRLAALKRFRENRLLIARKDLIRVEDRVSELTRAMRRAVSERSDLIGADEARLRLLYACLVESETSRIRRLEADLREAEQERDRHARWVAHLGRELKAIERLEERKREDFDAEVKLREKRASDNWVAERWSHSNAPGKESA